MEKLELNLGPFNPCCDYLRTNTLPEYPGDFYGDKIYYYSDQMKIESKDVSSNIFIPIFKLSFTSNNPREKGRLELIRKMEFEIIRMIYSLMDNSGIIPKPNMIVIPIKSFNIFPTSSHTIEIVAELGIGIFLKEENLESANSCPSYIR